MLKKIIYFILLFFSFIWITSAAFKYKYVCDNNLCYNTTRDFIWNNYYLSNVTETSITSFSSYLNTLLSWYTDYYDWINYEIKWYCDWTCDIISNKQVTLKDLLKINKPFNIWKEKFFWFWNNEIIETYDSWKDYLFSNFSDVIYELHNWFPIWDLKNNLSDLSPNFLSYSNTNNTFSVRNVCQNDLCTITSNVNIAIDNTDPYILKYGDVKLSSNFKTDTFKVSDDYSISTLLLKAWETVNFNFWFEDYLDQNLSKTDYQYYIFYNYEWEWIPNITDDLNNEKTLSESFSVDWTWFTLSSPNLWENLNNVLDIKVLNSDDKKIRVWINEKFNLTKAWNVYFYLAAKNISSWDTFNVSQINSIPLKVVSNDDIKTYKATITSAFSSELNSNTYWFNENQPFSVEVKLFDEYWNIHTDNISWYDIWISNWTSQDIQISPSWSDSFSNYIQWIKSTSNNTIQFDFRITKPWYHDLKWFEIVARSKSDFTTYVSPVVYNTLSEVIPNNLYDWSKLMKIYIKEPLHSSLPISCWKSVSINYVCTSDDFSWCNVSGDTNVLYSNQSDNWKTWSLSIIDNAYNKKIYDYTINHVDQTAPIISLTKWWIEHLTNDTYYYIVNEDDLKIDFSEWTTSSCVAEVNYLVKIDWVTKYNWVLDWVNTNYVVNDFFKKSWIHDLYIKATDKYWNFSEKTLNFNLYPSVIDNNNTTIVLNSTTPKNSKYANYSDEYSYTVTLKDKFWNPIYDKNILSFNTDCTWTTWCVNIKTKIWNTWSDAIIETVPKKTDSNWSFTLNLKSYAPWVFKELFKIKLSDWNNHYIDLSSTTIYDIWLFTKQNSFKKPISWKLTIIDSSVPMLWKLDKYKVELVKPNDLSNFSITNWFLDLSKFTIYDKIDWHFWNNFYLINSDFWDNINTFLWFSWTIDADSNILIWPNVSTDKLYISYKLSWVNVEYYLDDFWLKWCDSSTLWLKVIWTLQWDWKSNITWQKDNFSDLEKSELRSKIRQNWYNLTKWMLNWQIVNWVKFVKWQDIILSWNDLWYETLVVRDWNVIISWDLNTNWKKLWIIVLRDNYNVYEDYKTLWNVFVNKDVENISAIIYADWWFISAKDKNNFYNDSELNKILKLNWTLFTRNTIWWAIKWNSKYTLPWWQETVQFPKAKLYDLNYTRLVWNNCSVSDNYSFLIKYESSIQANPPKWFEN